ncbi:hypothetical protein BLOT_015290 [Blomia tropicalis]|nr:hypothetical protein BLOT_015290 [Blomia tropicalis]
MMMMPNKCLDETNGGNRLARLTRTKRAYANECRNQLISVHKLSGNCSSRQRNGTEQFYVFLHTFNPSPSSLEIN